MSVFSILIVNKVKGTIIINNKNGMYDAALIKFEP